MLIRVPKNQIKPLRLALLIAESRMAKYDKRKIGNGIWELNQNAIQAIHNVLHQTWRKVKGVE